MRLREIQQTMADPKGGPVDDPIRNAGLSRGTNRLRAHQMAERQTAGKEPVPSVKTQGLAHFQALIDTDKLKLKSAKTLEEKAKIKRGFLPDLLPFVLDYIEQGHSYPNSVAVQVAIWLFDVGDIEQAWKVSRVLAHQNQPTPKEFDRDLPTIICDAMYDWANEQLKNDQPAAPYLEELARTIIAEEWSLAPPVASKVFAMTAKHAFRIEAWQETIDWCEKAQAVNPEGAGVKGLMTNARSKLG